MFKFISIEKVSNINNLLIGNDLKFTAEHQILNGSLIIIVIIYLLTFILNFTPELDAMLELKISNISMTYLRIFQQM